MKKSQISAVMRELNTRRNKKYGSEWRKLNASNASKKRWEKYRAQTKTPPRVTI